MTTGWIARRGKKRVERFTPTPELVHGVVVASPSMAQAMRKAGIFSGKSVNLDGAAVDVETLLGATYEARAGHYEEEMKKNDAASQADDRGRQAT